MISNLLKSVFISGYATYVFVGTAVSLVALLRSPAVAWAGACLAHLPMAFLFGRLLLLRNLARTHRWLPAITGLTLAGAAIAISGHFTTGTAPAIMGLTALGGYLVYLVWYSRFDRPMAHLLAPGRPLPPFRASDSAGNRFSSAELGGKPAVLLFYRGNWCPLCMAQIKEIADGYRELAARNIQVVLISPQSQAKTARLARRFEAPLRFVVDKNNRIARQLGIAWQHALPFGMQLLGYSSESVLPTVIVVDDAGRIVLADQTDNYRIRPEPATFITALED